MLIHPTLDQLRALKLDGMAQAFVELEAQEEAGNLAHAEWLALLLDREAANRNTKRFQSRLRSAKLRHGQASIEDVADAHFRSVKPSLGAKTRGTITTPEECLVGLVEPAKHLLLGAARPSRQVWQCLPDFGQCEGLVVGANWCFDRRDIGEVLPDVTFALGTAMIDVGPPDNFSPGIRGRAIGVDALFQAGVIELAEVGEHLAERSGLRPVRLDLVFVREYQLCGPSFRSCGSAVKSPSCASTRGGFAIYAAKTSDIQEKRRRFLCQLKQAVPAPNANGLGNSAPASRQHSRQAAAWRTRQKVAQNFFSLIDISGCGATALFFPLEYDP